MDCLSGKIERNEFAFIAEIGVNYYDIASRNGIELMEAAKLMCLEARECGADAVKFQSYKADQLAIRDSPAYWDTDKEETLSQHELFKKYDIFGADEYRELASYCDSIGIEFCSTAFDFHAADYLEDLVNVYKISSSDLTNIPFIEYQASKGKPLILSVGAADADEIDRAIKAIRRLNDMPLAILHCVLEYPTPYEDANLLRIETLRKAYPNLTIGYSDHCCPDPGANVIKAAYVLGARIIEKHFTLDKTIPGNDHYHAADPDDVRNIIDGIRLIDELLGTGELVALESESSARTFARRSIVAAKPIPKGSVISKDLLCFKRPGTGVSPHRINEFIGKVSIRDIDDDEQITFNMVD